MKKTTTILFLLIGIFYSFGQTPITEYDFSFKDGFKHILPFNQYIKIKSFTPIDSNLRVKKLQYYPSKYKITDNIIKNLEQLNQDTINQKIDSIREGLLTELKAPIKDYKKIKDLCKQFKKEIAEIKSCNQKERLNVVRKDIKKLLTYQSKSWFKNESLDIITLKGDDDKNHISTFQIKPLKAYESYIFEFVSITQNKKSTNQTKKLQKKVANAIDAYVKDSNINKEVSLKDTIKQILGEEFFLLDADGEPITDIPNTKIKDLPFYKTINDYSTDLKTLTANKKKLIPLIQTFKDHKDIPIKSNDVIISNSINRIKQILISKNQSDTKKLKNSYKAAIKNEKISKSTIKGIDEYKYYLNKEITNYLNSTATVETDKINLNYKIKDTYKVYTYNNQSNPNIFATDNNAYLSADIGLGYGFNSKTIFLSQTTNIYFTPTNRAAPDSQAVGSGFKKYFLNRFSLNLGIVQSLSDTPEKFNHLMGVTSPILGFGYRVPRILRFNIDGIFFMQKDKNPLVSSKKLNIEPMFSITINVKLKDLLPKFSKDKT
ncbi:hypothetical protein [Wenyingzhuangia sp. IMCC45574]